MAAVPTLAAYQASFMAALEDDASLGSALLSGDPLLAGRRLACYRRDIEVRHTRALAAAYPVVQALVGEEAFCALARTYRQAHPSQTGDLTAFGATFADMLAADMDRRDPHLGDVARLEWMIHRAYYAADAEPVPISVWRDLTAQDLAGARLTLHPAAALLSSPFAVDAIWTAYRAGGDRRMPDALTVPTQVFLARPQREVRLMTTSPGGYSALTALADDHTVVDAIDAAHACEPGFDLTRHLQAWIAAELICGVRLSAARVGL